MPKVSKNHSPKRAPKNRLSLRHHTSRWWQASIFHKVGLSLLLLVALAVGGMYAISRWYMAKHADEPLVIGATFIPAYAESFGLDAEETMDAVIHDLGIRHLRLVSYWNHGEAERDKLDFSFLDWQMEKAQANGVKVSLALGLRQPRWPECHMPAWAEKLPKQQWQAELLDYIEATVKRYRNHPALESWQLENEYFLKVFGICPDHSRDRLVEEFELVKRLDPSRPVIVTRSNNALGWPNGAPQPDKSGVTVYKRVWDKTITKRYIEYPFPAWYYGFLAGWYELMSGRDTFVHELQTEAWLPDGFDMRTAPIEEFYKSLSPKRLSDRIRYGAATGMRRVDLWGVEWWYYLKTHRAAPELWNTGKAEIRRLTDDN